MALSSRAIKAAKASEGQIQWDVSSNLWHPAKNPSGWSNLGLAENSLMHEILLEKVDKIPPLTDKALTYNDGPSGMKRVKSAIGKFLTKHLAAHTPIQPDHLLITNGCTSAIEHLSWAFANPGEAWLLGQPFYGAFIDDLELRTGARVVPVPFHHVDPMGQDCVQKYKDALLAAEARGVKVAGLILSHPHNPLGRCYPRDAIVDLMKLCEEHQVHFVSDEIYAFSVFPNTVDKAPPPVPFVSALSIDTTNIMDPARLHVLWGMSKGFGANGIRLGAIISQKNPVLHAALFPACVYSGASSLAQHVTIGILEDTAWVDSYIVENQRRLMQQYVLVVGWAKKHDIEYTPGVNAAFFLWANLGKNYLARHPDILPDDVDEAVNRALLGEKVFLASGKNFGSERPGWFRIVFASKDLFLAEGLRRIGLALGF